MNETETIVEIVQAVVPLIGYFNLLPIDLLLLIGGVTGATLKHLEVRKDRKRIKSPNLFLQDEGETLE